MRLLLLAWLAATPGAITWKVVDPNPPADPWVKIAADLDGDGRGDLIAGGRNGPLVWYQAPQFSRHLIASGGYRTVGGAAADIDADGDLDLVLGGTLWYENPGSLAANPGRSWTAHVVADDSTHDALAADLDGDGRVDIVTRNQSEFGARAGDRIRVWLQRAPDRWEGVTIPCPHGEGIALADLDRDGDPDIVTGGLWFETVRGGAGPSWTRHHFADYHPNASIAVADLNRDGRPDIILAPSELAGQHSRLAWWEAPKDPRSGKWKERVIAAPVECVIHGIQAADFDLDGNPDVVFAQMHQGQDPDQVGVFLNRQRGRRWDKQQFSTRGSHTIQVADVDGDGDPDVFGANWSGPYQPLELWLNGAR